MTAPDATEDWGDFAAAPPAAAPAPTAADSAAADDDDLFAKLREAQPTSPVAAGQSHGAASAAGAGRAGDDDDDDDDDVEGSSLLTATGTTPSEAATGPGAAGGGSATPERRGSFSFFGTRPRSKSSMGSTGSQERGRSLSGLFFRQQTKPRSGSESSPAVKVLGLDGEEVLVNLLLSGNIVQKNKGLGALVNIQSLEEDAGIVPVMITGSASRRALVNEIKTHATYVPQELKAYTGFVKRYVVESLKNLIERIGDCDDILEAADKAGIDAVLELNVADHLTIPQLNYTLLGRVWDLPAIQGAYTASTNVDIAYESAYFFRELERICAADYVATAEDVAHLPTMTSPTTYWTKAVTLSGMSLRFVDAGCSWVPTDLTTLHQGIKKPAVYVFWVDLMDYDSHDAQGASYLQAALGLFERIVLRRKRVPPILVVLDNVKKFRYRLQQVRLRDTFPDYGGENTFDASLDFIKSRFTKIVTDRVPEKNREFAICVDPDSPQAALNEVVQFLRGASTRKRLVAMGL